MKKLLIIALSLLCGCGGGGSGGDASFLAGFYKVTYILTNNSCAFTLPPFDVIYSIDQADKNITVRGDATHPATYSGFVTGDMAITSRSGSNNCRDQNGQSSSVMSTFTESLNLDFTSNDTADAEIVGQLGDCPGDSVNTACEYTFRGNMTRLP